MMPIALMLHVLSVAIWVGGMFFAYEWLRPVAAQQLGPLERLRLWRGVFGRFFPWVWSAVALILASGLTMLLAVGMRAAPLNWHLMLLGGLAMVAVFLIVFFLPYRALARAVDAQDAAAGAQALARIRRLVGINLVLGVLTIAMATAGRLIA